MNITHPPKIDLENELIQKLWTDEILSINNEFNSQRLMDQYEMTF